LALFSDVETSVRANTDQVDTGRTSQALILSLANEEYEEVIKRLAEAAAPDFYRTYSADLTVSSTSSPYIDVSSLATAFKFLEVQRKVGSRYFTIDPASSPNPEIDPKFTWRQRGFFGTGCKIDVFPPESSVGTYRVHYAAFPGALTASPDATLALPLGGRKYLAACVSARIRHREEEDEAYMIAIRNDAFANLTRGLSPSGLVIGTRGAY
jgi:hypothetical protein